MAGDSMRNNGKHMVSRRRFLKLGGAVAVGCLPGSDRAALANLTTTGTKDPSPNVVKNKAPLAQNAFYMLPLGAVRPSGWLKKQMQIQANGLSGHLDETWADVGSNSGWLGGTGESWERGPYFLDGLVPLAYLLDDARLKAKAQKFIDWSLTHQATHRMI